MKKMFGILFTSFVIAAFGLILGLFFLLTPAKAARCEYNGHVYNDELNYMKVMQTCAEEGDEWSMKLGKIAEFQRNIKLEALGYGNFTNYFTESRNGDDVLIMMARDSMKAEHEEAAIVYEVLARENFSNVAIAGILGNMMNECGGNTLKLQPYVYEVEYGRHYGLCQWSLYYCPETRDLGLYAQLHYLVDTIRDNMTAFGGSFEKFNTLEDPSEAAKYFCNYYERGQNISQRQRNAVAAMDWINKHVG